MPAYHQQFHQGMNPHNHMGYKMQQSNRCQAPDPDSEQFRKLFVGGLCYETDDKSLREFFSKYGEVKDCVVMRDVQSKRSRGFGFITFKDKDSVDEVQRGRKHHLDGRDVETKRAMPRDDPSFNNQTSVNKMFIGGLKDDTTEEMVKSEFSKFGNIKEVELITDKNTQKSKGFCFVTFDDYDPVDKLVLKRCMQFNGKMVELKKAYAKGEADRYGRMGMGMGMFMGHHGGNMQMHRGGRGDYAGGYNRDMYNGARSYHNSNNQFWAPPAYNDFYNHHSHRGNYSNNYPQNQQFNNRR